jgi:hypothetical protein
VYLAGADTGSFEINRNFTLYPLILEHTLTQLFETLHYKPEGGDFDSG